MSTRYNGFWLTHKALRAMLYDGALALQHTDQAGGKPPAATLEKIEKIVWAFDKHADLEDDYILPLVRQTHPSLFTSFEKEHEEDHLLTAALRTQLTAWKASAFDETQFLQLFYAFNDFLAFNIAHMNKEESVLLNAIWQKHTDEALLALHAEIIQTREPEERATSLQWMFRGCNTREITQILLNAKKQMPANQYAGFEDLAREGAGMDRWQDISTRLAAQLVSATT